MKKFYYEFDFLRVFLTILVVWVHSFYIYNYGVLSSLPDFFLNIERFLTNEVINKFMMPLFVFISGFLFSHQYSATVNSFSIKKVLSKKFKRLVIPYICCFPITAMCAGSILDLKIIDFVYPMEHLWFLLMLYWCFVITSIFYYFFGNVNKHSAFLFLLLSFVLAVYKGHVPEILGLRDFSALYFFFFLGIVYQHYSYLLNSKKIVYSFSLLLILSASVFTLLELHFTKQLHFTWARIAYVISSISIVQFLYCLVRNIDKTPPPMVSKLSYYSLSIYICHPWFMNLVTQNADVVLLAQQYVHLFPIVLFIAASLFSYYFSKFVLKTQIGRFIFG